MNNQLNEINLNSKIKEIQQLRNKGIPSKIGIKEESIKRLLDFDVGPAKAKRYVEVVIKKNIGEIGVQDVAKQAYRILIEDENNKAKDRDASKDTMEFYRRKTWN